MGRVASKLTHGHFGAGVHRAHLAHMMIDAAHHLSHESVSTSGGTPTPPPSTPNNGPSPPTESEEETIPTAAAAAAAAAAVDPLQESLRAFRRNAEAVAALAEREELKQKTASRRVTQNQEIQHIHMQERLAKKRRMKKTLHALDSDGDGFVAWSDLRVLIPTGRKLAHMETEEEVEGILKEMLSEFDAAGKGVLDLAETSRLLHELESSDLLQHCAERVHALVVEKSHDLRRERAEAGRAVEPSVEGESDHPTREDINSVFAELDHEFDFMKVVRVRACVAKFARQFTTPLEVAAIENPGQVVSEGGGAGQAVEMPVAPDAPAALAPPAALLEVVADSTLPPPMLAADEASMKRRTLHRKELRAKIAKAAGDEKRKLEELDRTLQLEADAAMAELQRPMVRDTNLAAQQQQASSLALPRQRDLSEIPVAPLDAQMPSKYAPGAPRSMLNLREASASAPSLGHNTPTPPPTGGAEADARPQSVPQPPPTPPQGVASATTLSIDAFFRDDAEATLEMAASLLPTPLGSANPKPPPGRAPVPYSTPHPGDIMAILRSELSGVSLLALLPELFSLSPDGVSVAHFCIVLARQLTETDAASHERLAAAIAACDPSNLSGRSTTAGGDWLQRRTVVAALSVLCVGELEVISCIFELFDLDQNGSLARAEFEEFLHIVLVMSLNLDGNGHPVHQQRALETGAALSSTIFDQIDTDKSAEISRKEFTQWFGSVVANWATSATLLSAIQNSASSPRNSEIRKYYSEASPSAAAHTSSAIQREWDGGASAMNALQGAQSGIRRPVRHKGGAGGKNRAHSVFHGVADNIAAIHKDHASGLIHPQPAYFEKKASTGLKRWQKRWFKLSNNYLVYSSNEEATRDSTRSIDLRQISNILPNSSISGKYEFQLLHSDEKGGSDTLQRVRVRVPSRMALDLWVDAMRQRQRHVFRPATTLGGERSGELGVDEFASAALAPQVIMQAGMTEGERRQLQDALERAAVAEKVSEALSETVANAKAGAGTLAKRLSATRGERDALLAERDALNIRLQQALDVPQVAVDDATVALAVSAQVRRKMAADITLRAHCEALERRVKDYPSLQEAALKGQRAMKEQRVVLDMTQVELVRANCFAKQAAGAHTRAMEKCARIQSALDAALASGDEMEVRLSRLLEHNAKLVEAMRVAQHAENEREAKLLEETAVAENSLREQQETSLAREAALLAEAESRELAANVATMESAAASAAALADVVSRAEVAEAALVAERTNVAELRERCDGLTVQQAEAAATEASLRGECATLKALIDEHVRNCSRLPTSNHSHHHLPHCSLTPP